MASNEVIKFTVTPGEDPDTLKRKATNRDSLEKGRGARTLFAINANINASRSLRSPILQGASL